MTLKDRILAIQYYNGLATLKTVLLNFLATVTALETNSVIVGKLKLGAQLITNGTPFIVGEKYWVVPQGGDFSNIGWTEGSKIFTATGTTPTLWESGSIVKKVYTSSDIFFNDVDSNLTISPVDGTSGTYTIQITNGKFLDNKTYPSSSIIMSKVNTNIFSFDGASYISNTQSQDVFFKIEVYN